MMKIPKIVEAYYPDLIWRMPNNEKKIYLTFDDGPTPYITKFVLDQLKQYDAHATFFCLGKNVKNHPVIYKRIVREGHSVGNHTYDHKNGWQTKNYDYFKNVMKGSRYIDTDLFRPPYGRIKKAQIRRIKDRYRIVMWDVLSEDYNQKITSDQCWNKVMNQTKNGSIIVFHDSRKASKHLKIVLPRVLEEFSNQGFKFDSIH